jgi:hypothetical protein
MRGSLRAAVAAFLMRSVGRRVEDGQPRRRFMGGSEEGGDIVVMVRLRSHGFVTMQRCVEVVRLCLSVDLRWVSGSGQVDP